MTGYIAFDGGGGATLVVGRRYAHLYDDGVSLARDVLSLFCGGAVSDWDGHEPSRLSLDYDEGYHVWRLDVVRNVIANPCNMSIADNDITIPSVEIIFRVIPSVCFGGRLQLANFGGRAAPMAA
jgi:hypothetical protein